MERGLYPDAAHGARLLNDMALSWAVTAVNTLTVLGYIALLADTFRAQKEFIRTEGEKP